MAEVARVPTQGLTPINVELHPTKPLAYVLHRDSDDVSVIDIQQRRFLYKLPSLPPSEQPLEMEITPNGQYLLVALWPSESLYVYRLSSDTIAGVVPGVGAGPISITPDSKRAYVIQGGLFNPNQLVSVVDINAIAEIDEIPSGGSQGYDSPGDLEATNRKVYWPLFSHGTNSGIRVATQPQHSYNDILVGLPALLMQLSHDQTMLAAGGAAEAFVIVDTVMEALSCRSVAYGWGASPSGFRFTPDDRRLYAIAGGSSTTLVSVTDPTNCQILTTINKTAAVPNAVPLDTKLTADGRYYVFFSYINPQHNAVFVDTTTDQIAAVVPVGAQAWDVETTGLVD